MGSLLEILKDEPVEAVLKITPRRKSAIFTVYNIKAVYDPIAYFCTLRAELR